MSNEVVLSSKGLSKRFVEGGLTVDVLRSIDLEVLRGELEAGDPVLARRIEPGDRQRTLRGLEVFAATGRALSRWQQDAPSPALLEGMRVARVLLMPARAALHARCDARLDAMLEEGLLEEIRALKARNLAPGLPAMKALGVARLIDHLGGGCSLQDAVAAVKTDTRRYAKRQMTWFRNRMSHWPAYETAHGAALLANVRGALGLMPDIPA